MSRPIAVEPEVREAVQRDLECFADCWTNALQIEVEAPYGRQVPTEADLASLRQAGTFIDDVTLTLHDDILTARWSGDGGENIKDGPDKPESIVVISRTHPCKDLLTTASLKQRRWGELQLSAKNVLREAGSGADRDSRPDILDGKWRLDREVNWIPLFRTTKALGKFTRLYGDPSALQMLLGAQEHIAQEKRNLNTTSEPDPLAATGHEAFANLNESQRLAVGQSMTQKALCIQGPAGTGKTQTADAILQIYCSLPHQTPMVAAAPSNVGADNIACRMLQSPYLRVKRYGHLADPAMQSISAGRMARDANDWERDSKSKGAKQR